MSPGFLLLLVNFERSVDMGRKVLFLQVNSKELQKYIIYLFKNLNYVLIKHSIRYTY